MFIEHSLCHIVFRLGLIIFRISSNNRWKLSSGCIVILCVIRSTFANDIPYEEMNYLNTLRYWRSDTFCLILGQTVENVWSVCDFSKSPNLTFCVADFTSSDKKHSGPSTFWIEMRKQIAHEHATQHLYRVIRNDYE